MSVCPGIPPPREVFHSNPKTSTMSLPGMCRTRHPRNHREENPPPKTPEYSAQTHIKQTRIYMNQTPPQQFQTFRHSSGGNSSSKNTLGEFMEHEGTRICSGNPKPPWGMQRWRAGCCLSFRKWGWSHLNCLSGQDFTHEDGIWEGLEMAKSTAALPSPAVTAWVSSDTPGFGTKTK